MNCIGVNHIEVSDGTEVREIPFETLDSIRDLVRAYVRSPRTAWLHVNVYNFDGELGQYMWDRSGWSFYCAETGRMEITGNDFRHVAI